MKKFLLLISSFLLMQINCVYAQIDFILVNSDEEWDNVLQNAEEEDKPIFVDIYTDWCGYCKKMDKDVFSDTEVIEFVNEHYLGIKIDGESEFGKGFATVHQVSGFPTYAFIDGKNDALGYLEGYNAKGAFLEAGQGIYDKFHMIKKYDAEYLAGNLNNEELISYYATTVNQSTKEEIYNKLFSALGNEAIPSKEFVHFLVTTDIYVGDKAYQFIKKHQDIIKKDHGEEEFQDIVNSIYETTLTQAIITRDEEILNLVLDEFIPNFLAEETQSVASFDSKKIYNAYTNNWKNYEGLIMERLQTESISEVTTYYYNEALTIVNDYKESEEALLIAEKFLAEVVDVDKDFDSYLLSAYTKALLGKKEKAMAFLEKATALVSNDEEGDLVNNIKTLLEQVN